MKCKKGGVVLITIPLFFKKITEPASASSVIKHWLILTVKVVLLCPPEYPEDSN